VIVTVVAAYLGFWVQFERLRNEKDRQAVKQALESRRLKTDPDAPEWPVT
jgi:hypothetical protein